MLRFIKAKSVIYDYIIIKEWMENGEFKDAENIVVSGTRIQVAVVKLLFKKSGKKIYCCRNLKKQYAHRRHWKWIVFDRDMKKDWALNDSSVLLMPDW